MTAVEPAIPGVSLRPHFRSLLEYWDSTPRQGLPQICAGQAAFLWRGTGEDFASLHLAPEAELRAAWQVPGGQSASLGSSAQPPGVRVPAPPKTVVRGFSLSPDGRRIAALLSSPKTELAEVWIVSPEAAPIRVPDVSAWYSAPLWDADGISLWLLSGKPPSQRILRCRLRTGASEELAFPADIASDLTGFRLSLSSSEKRVRFTAHAPGASPRHWELAAAGWRPVAEDGSHSGDAAPSDAPRLALKEHDGGTLLTLAGHPFHSLSPAEQLRALSLHTDGENTVVWIHTASPERPSGVCCVEVPSLTATTEKPTTGKQTSDRSAGSSGQFIHLRVHAPASDGVEIPLIISAHAAGLGTDGRPLRPLPLILTCYGGFGVAHRTEAEPSVPAWLEHGGIYVAAQLRGGGELGKAWHEAGRGTNKMRSILDLVDVARYLAETGWTTPAQTVAFGASHGGLVVTAAALLSPTSFGGTVAVAPLLDTVNLNRHGLGRQWLHEFGADGECSAPERAAYSPVHLLNQLEDAPGDNAAAQLPPLLCCLLGRDERVDNSAAIEFVNGVRSLGGRAWLCHEDNGGHGQRASADVLEFSSAVLAFAAAPDV